MKIISPDQDSEMLTAQMEEDHAEAPKENIFMKKYALDNMFFRLSLIKCRGLMPLYYAPRIFGEAGLGEKQRFQHQSGGL